MVPPGGQSGVEPPVPIPNTEVKRPSADDTRGAALWENMPPPGGLNISACLQPFYTIPLGELAIRGHPRQRAFPLGTPSHRNHSGMPPAKPEGGAVDGCP